tara:strand:- start:872 stop:1798 length:927 start_codon:yes stop_codon:yes gene_type:complete
MAYIGNPVDTAFTSLEKQDFSNPSGTSLTLAHAVANANDIALYINNVRQEPTEAYSVNGTTVTLTGSVSNSDDIYVIYLARAVQTTVPPDSSVSTTKIADDAITTAKIADNAVTSAQIASGAVDIPGYKFIAKQSIDIGGTAAFSLLFNNTVVTSAFNNYRLVFNNIRPTNNGSQLYLRCSIDNGNSGLSNAQGQKTYFRLDDGATGSEDDDNMNTHEIATNVGSDQYDGVTGIVDIFGTGNNAINLQRTMVIQSRATGREDSNWYKWDGAAYVTAGTRSSMVNCIFLLFNAGNIADGSVCLYGMNEG